MGGLSLPKLRFILRALRVVVVVNKVALGQASVLPCHTHSTTKLNSYVIRNQFWVIVPRPSTTKGVTVTSQVPVSLTYSRPHSLPPELRRTKYPEVRLYRHSPYRAVNTLRLTFKKLSVNVVKGDEVCLFLNI